MERHAADMEQINDGIEMHGSPPRAFIMMETPPTRLYHRRFSNSLVRENHQAWHSAIKRLCHLVRLVVRMQLHDERYRDTLDECLDLIHAIGEQAELHREFWRQFLKREVPECSV
jgi:hypothetical protein